MVANELGMVIRDPWYEFGTHPEHPDAPNIAFQDTIGASMAELGTRWVRLEFHIEGNNVAEQVARNDYFINEVAPRHGLKVLGLLNFDLLRGEDIQKLVKGKQGDDPVYGGGVNPYMHTWLDRARFIANRYKGNVHAYEVLNEHNRLPDATAIPAYLAACLHTKFYYWFHHRDREDVPAGESWRDRTPVIIGGLHPKGTGEPGKAWYVSDLEYLYEIYTHRWGGFPDYRETFGQFPTDGIAFHPYPEEIRGSLNRWPHYRDAQWEATMVAYRLDELRQELGWIGHPDVPFWITEIGYNVAFGDHDADGQARFMDALLSILLKRSDVAVSFWFKYEDFPPATGLYANQWGVVHIDFHADATCPDGARYTSDGKPAYVRPAYDVYRSFADAYA